MKSPAKPETTTFAAFAAANPIKPKCSICCFDADLRVQVRVARLDLGGSFERITSGGSFERITSWLKQVHGKDIGSSAVRAHFTNGHEK